MGIDGGTGSGSRDLGRGVGDDGMVASPEVGAAWRRVWMGIEVKFGSLFDGPARKGSFREDVDAIAEGAGLRRAAKPEGRGGESTTIASREVEYKAGSMTSCIGSRG
jgi:hypothetical protein